MMEPAPPPQQQQHGLEQMGEGSSGAGRGSGNMESHSGDPLVSQTPTHHQLGHGIMIDNGEGEYFANFAVMDGISYGVSNGDEGYNPQDFSSVFTCDDLYAVVDPANPTGTITEVEEPDSSTSAGVRGNPHNWQPCDFIPLGASDMKKLRGNSGSVVLESESSAVATGDNGGGEGYQHGEDGHYYKLVRVNDSHLNPHLQQHPTFSAASSDSTSRDSSAEPPPSPTRATAAGGGAASVSNSGGDAKETTPPSDPMPSPAAGVITAETTAKVRKPRGRKPKHVKEAEAAAAALAAANGPSSSGVPSVPPKEGTYASPSVDGVGISQRPIFRGGASTAEDVPPNVTIHHRGTGVLAPPPYSRNTCSSPSTSAPPSPYAGISSSSRMQMSLEQLAYHDRRVILTANRRPPVTNGGSDGSSNSNATGFLNRYPQQQQPPSYPHQAHQYARSPPHCPPPPQAANNFNTPPSSPHVQYGHGGGATSGGAGRLDQLFSSRIAAPSNKSTVKPKIIQENRSIYNLLTAPTTPRSGSDDFDTRKLSQERWTQYPNPSIIPDDASGMLARVDATSSTSGGGPVSSAALKQKLAAHHRSGAAPELQQPPQQASRYVIGNVPGGGFSIRRDGPPRHPSASQPPFRSGSGTPSSAANNNRRGGFGSTAYHPSFNNSQQVVEEMQMRMQHLSQENYELKCRAHYQNKLVKFMMTRLRHQYEQNEALKMYLEQNAQFSPRFGGGDAGGPAVMGPSTTAYLDDFFRMRDHRGNTCSVGTMAGGNDEGWDNGGGDLPPWRQMARSASLDEGLFLDEQDWSPRGGADAGGGRNGRVGDLKRNLSTEGGASPPNSKKISKDAATDAGGNGVGGEAAPEGKTGAEEGGSVNEIKTGPSPVLGQGQSATLFLDLATIKMEEKTPPKTQSDGGSSGAETSSSVATDIVMADEGENTTSTLFNSPVSGISGNGSFSPFPFSGSAFANNNATGGKIISRPIFNDVMVTGIAGDIGNIPQVDNRSHPASDNNNNQDLQ